MSFPSSYCTFAPVYCVFLLGNGQLRNTRGRGSRMRSWVWMISTPLELMMLTHQLMLYSEGGNRCVTFACFLEFSSIHEKALYPSPPFSRIVICTRKMPPFKTVCILLHIYIYNWTIFWFYLHIGRWDVSRVLHVCGMDRLCNLLALLVEFLVVLCPCVSRFDFYCSFLPTSSTFVFNQNAKMDTREIHRLTNWGT